jgi:hypothetical protein
MTVFFEGKKYKTGLAYITIFWNFCTQTKQLEKDTIIIKSWGAEGVTPLQWPVLLEKKLFTLDDIDHNHNHLFENCSQTKPKRRHYYFRSWVVTPLQHQRIKNETITVIFANLTTCPKMETSLVKIMSKVLTR